MWINGKEMVGEVLEKQRAGESTTVQTNAPRPGLLEQTDYRTFDLRIFPIAPRRPESEIIIIGAD